MIKGSHLTEIHKRRLSDAAMGKRGAKHSQETKDKIRLSNLGKLHPMTSAKLKGRPKSEEHRKKLSLANKGKKWTEEMKKKKSESCKGEKHWAWLEDRSKLKGYNLDNEDRRSPIYKNWRKQVWLRDGFKCKIANPDCKGRIEAHHILGWSLYPELRFEVNNGITLCHFHHPRKRKDESKLSPYFQQLVAEMN